MGSRTHIDAEEIELLDELARYEKKALPENTRRAYASDWGDFRAWCARRRKPSLPATSQTVSLYLAAKARRLRPGSLRRRLLVISKVHCASGKTDPTRDERVKKVWRGILREKSEATHHKAATLLSHLQQMMKVLPKDLSGLRDRAVILLGFAGAMRRSELVALNVSDLTLSDDGFIVQIRRSKTDQTGRGRKIGVPYGSNALTCPVRALISWLEASAIFEGALFRKVNRHGNLEGDRLSDRAVALIVKDAARLAGLNPKNFAGHSLRAGLATAAAIAGADERSIQEQTGHRSLKVLRSYIRDGSLFRNNAAKKSGL